MPKLAELNAMDCGEFTRTVGPTFEHSPWIAARAWPQRPFASAEELLRALSSVVNAATGDEKLALVRAHPDLVTRAELTPASQHEQASAGLSELSENERATFRNLNSAYRERFGFPFVICARMNDKQAMIEAFITRGKNPPELELQTALGEIFQIAKLRLADLLDE